MTLSPGTRLGPYEVLSPLGAGGMGEVYRAKDSRLGRDVAVKVLPQHLSSSPDLRARFEREARAVSSLNHPHICTLHDIGREGDTDYLVMELVDGETLADRLSRGPLLLPDVIRIGMQVADALDRAHRAGIVHRDLKPGNIMLTRAGAKLMDFGLARATGLLGPSSGSGVTLAALTQSPTVAQPLTAEGTIVGTFQYMAPEQLEGKEADARSDIWSLGCVLYEMATGKRAFDSSSQASLIGAIMFKEPPPLADLAPMSPPALDRLVRACLAKDPHDRVQSAHDVKLQLGWLAEGSAVTAAPAIGVAPPAPKGTPRAGSALAAAAFLAAGILAGALAWNVLRPAPKENVSLRFTIPSPPGADLTPDPNEQAISPDGKQIVFLANDSTGTGGLWLRPLGSFEARLLPGTKNGYLPFWSPDGRQIGFFADDKLKRVSTEGGGSEPICEISAGRGASWSPKGVIVFCPGPTGPLFQVRASGGTPEPVTVVDSAHGETAHRWPSFLPDGEHFTYAALPTKDGRYAAYVGSIRSKERRPLFSADGAPAYAAPGDLIFSKNGALVAQRFDPSRLTLAGDPFTVGDAPGATNYTGAPGFSVSSNGVLSWVSAGKQETRLVWLDRAGHDVGRVDIPLDRWGQIVMSHDGRRALVEQEGAAGTVDIWTVDIAREVANRVTFKTGKNTLGAWSPDGRDFAFGSTRNGPRDIYRRAADGSGSDQLVYASQVPFKSPFDWSPDGKWIVFGEIGDASGWNLMLVPAAGGPAVPYLVTPFNEQNAQISRDGRWLLYSSDESGISQAYIQSFPTPGRKQQVTKTGAIFAEWAKNNQEIIVLRTDFKLVSIPLEWGEEITFGAPRELYAFPLDSRGWTSSPDATKFLVTLPVQRTAPGISVAVNWAAGRDGSTR